VKRGRIATINGPTMILHMPLASMSSMTVAAREIENGEKRRFPLDPEKFWGKRVNVTEMLLTLPDGWRAALPKSVRAEGKFGIYRAEYSQQGNVLRLARHVEGTTGVQPPQAIAEFVAWLRAVGVDDAKMIVLTRETR
jgi:hypothetical protein